jgi:Flp pilus assembly pilin Flp
MLRPGREFFVSLLAIDRRALRQRLKGLANDDALAVTEYGMLVAFLAMALIAVVYIFGTQIAAWFTGKTANITTV